MNAEPEEQRQHLNQWSIPDWAIPIDSTDKKEAWLQWSFIISSNADAPSPCLSTGMKTAAPATKEMDAEWTKYPNGDEAWRQFHVK